jgi:hypothetical protein
MNLFIYKIESIRQTFQSKIHVQRVAPFKLQRIKWAESTSSQGHSCILMRNKEINTYNADERKYQIYRLKTVYIINSITNFDVRLPKICHS